MQSQQMSSGVHGAAVSYNEPSVVYNNMLVPIRSTTYDRYQAGQSKGLGTILILIGIACISLNGVCIAMQDNNYDDLSFIGHGIWSGVMFIITGGLGVGAGANRTKCLIVSFMVMCIISSIATISLVAVGSLAAAILADDCSNNYGYNRGYPYYNLPCGTTSGYIVIVAMEASMAGLGFIAGVIMIWGSAISCCSGVCGCCSQSTPIVAPQSSGNFPNNGQAIYFTQSQTGQPHYPQQYPYSQGMMAQPQVANYARPQWTMHSPNDTNSRFIGQANATVQVPDDFMGHEHHAG